jgi:hypothetical protein
MAGNKSPHEYFFNLLVDVHGRLGSRNAVDSFFIPFPDKWLTVNGIIKDVVLKELELLRAESLILSFGLENFGSIDMKGKDGEFQAYLTINYDGARLNEFLYDCELYSFEHLRPRMQILNNKMVTSRNENRDLFVVRTMLGKQIKEYLIDKDNSEKAKLYRYIYHNIYDQMEIPNQAKTVIKEILPFGKAMPTYTTNYVKILRGKLSNLNNELSRKSFPFYFSMKAEGDDVSFSIKSVLARSRDLRSKK